MGNESQDLPKVIADLKLIKEAISKSDSIIRFIDTGGAVKSILLALGLLIAVFSAVFYFLVEVYGSYGDIPANLRTILFVLIGIACCVLGYFKIRNFLKNAREIGKDMTLFRLFDEIYTTPLLALQIPYLLVIALVVIFLSIGGYQLYITPSLAILFGLLMVSLSPLIFKSEFYFLSMWLITTGLLALFTATIIHPLVAIIITFAAGFLVSSLLLYLDLPWEKSKER